MFGNVQRLERNAFRAALADKPMAVEDLRSQPGIRESAAMQTIVTRAAGADGVLAGTAEVDRVFDDMRRAFGPRSLLQLADPALHMRPGGATARAVEGLKTARGLSRTDAPGDAARASLERTTQAHHAQRQATGIGTHFGDASAYAKLDDAGRARWLASRATPGTTPPSPSSLTSSSCIGWTMEHVQRWYQAAGKMDRWREVERAVKAENMTGVALARELRKDGWQALYNNPDTSWAGTAEAPDNEHRYSLHVARTSGTYYGVPVDGMLTDWGNDPSKLSALAKAPFFVHVARGGLHVTAGTRGSISEFARNEGPDGQGIYQDPLARIVDVYADVYGGGDNGRARAMHMWGSGLTLVPPGSRLR
jgi:hypothetical protein